MLTTHRTALTEDNKMHACMNEWMNADKIWALFQVTCYLVSCPAVNWTNRIVGLAFACQQWNQIEVFIIIIIIKYHMTKKYIKSQISCFICHLLWVVFSLSSSKYFQLRIWLKGILRCIRMYCRLVKFHGQNRVI